MFLPALVGVSLLLPVASAFLNTLGTCFPGAVYAPGTAFYYAPSDVEVFNQGFGVYSGPCTAGSVATISVFSPDGRSYPCDDLPLGSAVSDIYCPGVIRGTMQVGNWIFVFNMGSAGTSTATYTITHTQITVEAATPTVFFTSTPTMFVTSTSTNVVMSTETSLQVFVTSPSATAKCTSTIRPVTTLSLTSTKFYTRTSWIHTVTKVTSTKVAKCTSLSQCPKKAKSGRNLLALIHARDWTPDGPLTTTTTPAAVSSTVVADTVITSTDTVFTDSTSITTAAATPATVTIFSGVTTATVTFPTSTKTRLRITTSKTTVTSTDIATITRVVTTTPLCVK